MRILTPAVSRVAANGRLRRVPAAGDVVLLRPERLAFSGLWNELSPVLNSLQTSLDYIDGCREARDAEAPLESNAISKRTAGIVAVVGAVLSCAAWGQPERTALPTAVWTPSADAPAGALTHKLEGQRHDRAIDIARKGDIDVVFFGTTNTEMWSWPDRGRGVWDRAFASIKAANFGSQGTSAKSVLWRMQNGELAGYHAKLVVLSIDFCFSERVAVAGDDLAAAVPNCIPIVAEIRARQPQAKILLLAPFPRGQQSRDDWREIAKAEALAFGRLVDDRNVFYADIGERFYLPDGSFNQDMWRVGMQPAGFEVWSEELEPWLDRFVR